MDPELRRAWTETVTPDDYDQHMSAIGQAEACAELTGALIDAAGPARGSRIVIAGAGTGLLFDLLPGGVFQPFRVMCTDLNDEYLARLRGRAAARGVFVETLVDDIENTRVEPGADLLIATLLLEHIDWRRGVEVFASLRPHACAILIQENPPEMSTAVTPARKLPASLEEAVKTAHPILVPADELIAAMAARGYAVRERAVRDVADGKKIAGLLFVMQSLDRIDTSGA
jgi:hypothetical protein